MPTTPSARRRGRLPAAERAARERAILDIALAELIERGADGLSMLGVARRAGASKETLYAWFGDRDGLLAALIERNADQAISGVRDALDRPDNDARTTLVGFAIGLLRLLTGPASLALNRAAMSSPALAERLLRSGRHRVGPHVETYLAVLDDANTIAAPDPAASFELLYGLVVRDLQIRVLLGEPPPRPKELAARAAVAVDQFLRLGAVSD